MHISKKLDTMVASVVGFLGENGERSQVTLQKEYYLVIFPFNIVNIKLKCTFTSSCSIFFPQRNEQLKHYGKQYKRPAWSASMSQNVCAEAQTGKLRHMNNGDLPKGYGG